jgi:hypothetical protein
VSPPHRSADTQLPAAKDQAENPALLDEAPPRDIPLLWAVL